MKESLWIWILGAGGLFLFMTWWAIFDIARKEFDTIVKKALWGILVVLVPFIGCAVYWIVGARQGRKPGIQSTTEP